MILLRVSDQLGNQMFAYATIKSIAISNKLDFKLLKCSDARTPVVNDNDEEYGHNIDTIFSTVANDIVELSDNEINNFSIYKENIDEKCTCIYDKNLHNIGDNYVVDGHFICCKYIEENIDSVREWYRFPINILEQCKEEIEDIKRKHPSRKIVAIHFRNGKEYRKKGFLLQADYWEKAARKLEEILNEKPIYLLIYDEKTKITNAFQKKHECIDIRKSLVHDLCIMSMSDANIVCNSSFSMMGALLNPNNSPVICPSSYPVPYGYKPDDVYSDRWIKVKAYHDWFSYTAFRVKNRIINTKIYYKINNTFKKR